MTAVFHPLMQFASPRCGAGYVEACLLGFHRVTNMLSALSGSSASRDRLSPLGKHALYQRRAHGAAAAAKTHVTHIDNKRL